jgi:hypothetical protein
MSGAPKHDGTKAVVFDAEPVIIWADGDPGASTVTPYLPDTYHGNITTYISHVNFTEVYCNCAARSSRSYGQKKPTSFVSSGSSQSVRRRYGNVPPNVRTNTHLIFPSQHAFALATADVQDVPLLVGDDHHWDDPEHDGHEIIRVP